MNRTFFASLLLALPLAAADYTIDTAHSSAGFAVKHMMVSTVRGEIGIASGAVSYDDKNPAATRIEATLNAASVSTGNGKRDEHLKSADFFDAAKFPTLTFKSKKASKQGNTLAVVGDLTVRGVTKEVTLKVDNLSGEMKDPWGLLRRGATATTTINRKDFGLTYNSVLETGGVAVGEEVAITIDIAATRKPAEAATKKSD